MPRRPQRLRRQYKIQEVIKRRQVMLVQVVKEERGNKGAALTTYLSLAGRYCVLMPNTARGGGISRKITNAQDRSRLKGIAEELDVPEGMGVILRTAGASRTKAEVKRDFEYLLRMWETVRETTLASSAPTLVYEEGSLIKRAIRDLYSKEVDEIVVAGETGYREARQFMRLLMPTHVNAVQLYRDTQPVFAKAGVEQQLDAMFSNQVTLKSGGYIVINQTEALVAIDVNSGRSTREHNIEDTALRTNLEAADEIARQLRLRDLAGLIVVDFIDMEESRNNRAVERRIKDALKNDRARIQVGRISHFGLLEMSRQRIRTGVLEGSTVVCAHCQGAGVVRSTSSIALHVLRVLEDALIKSATHDIVVRTRTAGRALHPQPEAGEPARPRAPLRRGGLGRGRRHADRGELPRHRPRRARDRPAARDRARAAGAGRFRHHRRRAGADRGGGRGRDRDARRGRGRGGGRAGGPRARPRAPARAATATATDDDGGRRRRRRGRRGGERGFGESIAPDAPQPTDDGLAVVAEIGGDLAAPVVEKDPTKAAAPRRRRTRGRRSRRSRGGRNRFPPRVAEDSFLGSIGAEPGQLDAVEPDQADGAAHAGEQEGEFAAPSPAEPVELASPRQSVDGGDEAPAPPTEASVEETVSGEAVPDEGAPVEPTPIGNAPDAERVETAEALHAPQAAEEEPAPVAAAAEGESAEPLDDTPRPRRTGWWQRARMSVAGD